MPNSIFYFFESEFFKLLNKGVSSLDPVDTNDALGQDSFDISC